MLDKKGQVNQVCCMVCTFVEGQEKLLAPKLNNLLNKTKKSMPRVDADQFYFNKDSMRMKNELGYTIVSALVFETGKY
jgi:hypothetical protein